MNEIDQNKHKPNWFDSKIEKEFDWKVVRIKNGLRTTKLTVKKKDV